ncbi:MAG: hypothetical protein AAF846_17955 [Chloroflexota bacterium]
MRLSQETQSNTITFITIGIATRCTFVGAIAGLLYVLNYSLRAESLTQQEIFLAPILIAVGAFNGLQLGVIVGLIIASIIKWQLHQSNTATTKENLPFILHTMHKIIAGFAVVILALVIIGLSVFGVILLLPWYILLIVTISLITLHVAHRYAKQLR